MSQARAQQLARQWGLQLGEPAHATYSRVWFATRGEQHVVLKIGDGPARVREAAALRIYGAGEAPVCRLLDSDDDAVLVQRSIPGDDVRPLAAADDDAATEIIGGVILRLQESVAGAPQPSQLPDLATITRAFTDVPEHGKAPVPERLLDAGAALAVELSTPADGDTVLHGDLHHQNVLRSGWDPTTCGWLAIDPHGWWGDPTFDCVAMLLDLHDSTALAGLTDAEVRQRTRRRVAILAERTGFDAQRITAWAVAGAVISELWCWQDHRLVQHWPQRLAEVLLAG